MGTSITILESEILTLSIEIDRDINLEISTGFGANNRDQVVVSIPIDITKLETIKYEIDEVIKELKKSWVCINCSNINHPNAKECSLCNLLPKKTFKN
jgi:hypothetical protein